MRQIKSLGAKAGVVLNPGTPLTAIEYILDGEPIFFLFSICGYASVAYQTNHSGGT